MTERSHVVKCRVRWVLILLSLIPGCASHSPQATIPSWVGIPANVVTPNSLEAEAYRSQQAAAHADNAFRQPIAGPF